MFPRVKSSLLVTLGSLLTVVLMYHILKLSVTEKFTRYLDTTEITNYTLLESLLPSGTLYPRRESVCVCFLINTIFY